MGIIKDNKKFKPTKEQETATNPDGIIDKKNRKFSLDKETITEKRNSK
jgi:hypothetical protein